MPIEIRCPKCQAPFRLADEMAGKTMRCAKCKTTFPVPGAATATKPSPAPTPAPLPAEASPAVTPPAAPPSPHAAPVKKKAVPIVAIVAVAGIAVIGLGIAVTIVVIMMSSATDPLAKTKDDVPPAKKKDELKPPRERVIEPKPVVVLPIEVTFGPTGFEVNGSVDADAPRETDNAKPRRYQAYRLPLEGGRVYQLALAPGVRSIAGLRLYDPDGRLVDERIAGGAGAKVRLDYKALRAGAHRLHVVAETEIDMRYHLTITHDGLVAAAKIEPIKIALDKEGRLEAEAELTDNDAKTQDGKKRRKRFMVSLEPGRSYVLQVTRLDRAFEPCLELYGPDGKRIVGAEYDGKILGARVVVNPKEKGDYAVDATGTGDDRGKFTLRIVQQETLPFVFAGTGIAKQAGVLEPADPPDPRTGQPCKTYEVRLEAGKGYSFELRNNAFDALLQLFDPDGRLVAEDDDTTGGVPARVLIEPKTAGAYQLRVGAVKKELGKYNLQGQELVLPRPIASDTAVPVQKTAREDKLAVRTVTLGFSTQGHDALWSADGAALLLRDGNLSAVRRIRLKDLIEERHLAVGPDAVQMGLCAAGLVVPKKASREIWILDPTTLELSRRLPYFGKEVIAAPDFPLLFQIAAGQSEGKPVTGFVATDARKGAPRPRFVELDNLDLGASPDGRILLVHGPDRRLARYRFEGKGPMREEVAPHPSAAGKLPVTFRSDGQAALVLFDKELEPDDKAEPAPASGAGALVYAVGKLERPLFAVDTGKRPSALAFDPLKRFVYAGTETGALAVFSPKGKQREFKLALPDDESPAIRRIVPHPDGNLLAVLSEGGALYLVELPADLAALKAEPDAK
jgi:predicted Zn finger-like uncharacterized protein